MAVFLCFFRRTTYSAPEAFSDSCEVYVDWISHDIFRRSCKRFVPPIPFSRRVCAAVACPLTNGFVRMVCMK